MSKKKRLTREERSWVLYDVGNSAFVLVMVTAIMPIFFKDFAAAHLPASTSTAYWGVANSTASLILAFFSPLLGAMADYELRKKRFFLFFLIWGLIFTVSLTVIQQGQWVLCLFLFILARVGWSGANIFYDAFLVDVTTRARMDTVSSKGYGFGYIGSVVPFALVIGLILVGGLEFGLPERETKIGFLVVAVWWAVFSIPIFRYCKQIHFQRGDGGGLVTSFANLLTTFREIRKHKQIFLFLGAYFFYIDGVGTIISMSTAYGRDLGFGITLLIMVLLFIQIVAFPFALLFGLLAKRYSAKKMLLIGILVYSVVTVLAFLLPSVDNPDNKLILFWIIAFLVSSSMGGVQALSRSYFGKLIPPQKSAEFFGFYNVFGKFAAISGPAIMGVVSGVTGDSKWGILSILFLFVIGGLLLSQVKDADRVKK